jgi:squalene-associated FAD-dependent desaturase
MAARRVAVIGGGLAGLSAGLELRRAGFEVTLFERSRLLGGKATSFELDGIEVDNGQHVCLACCTAFIDFVKSLSGPWGDDPPLKLQDRFDALLLARGRTPARLRAVALPAPLHLAPSLLRYQYLPLRMRLGIARAVLQAGRKARPGETFAAWLSRHGQSAAARARFWDPFLVPALNAVPEEVAAEDALFVIRTAFLIDSRAARFGYARVPLARIAEAAARELQEVRLRTPVVGLDMCGGAAEGSGLRGVKLEDGSSLAFDGVVLAVPPVRLARIVDPAKVGLPGIEQFQMAPIVDVHLWYDVETAGFDFAALLESPVQWVFEKGAGYLCCSMSAADAYVSWSNAALVELCDRELRELVPALRNARLLRGSATRDRDATFVPIPGLRRPGPLTRYPNLVVAGAWTDTGWPATMESAVRSGRAAGRALAVQLSGSEVHVSG